MTWTLINTVVTDFNRVVNNVISVFQGRPISGTISAFFSVASNNLDMNFVDQSSSSVSAGTIVSWLWNFGDGGTSSLQHPTRTYAAAGNYVVTLVVTAVNGGQASYSALVTASAEPEVPPDPLFVPVAGFTVSTAGLTATFTDTSADSDGNVVAWNWGFGEAPTSDFTWSVTGFQSTFTNLASAPAPLSVTTYLWGFGDAATSASSNTKHTYAAGGAYPVSLTVTASNGNTDVTQNTVSIVSSASTTTVALGIPFGATQTFSGTASRPAAAALMTLTQDVMTPGGFDQRVAYAAANGIKMIVYLTGGAAAGYVTNGVFDSSKWTAKLETFNTPALKTSMASAVSAGVILAASMIDEPFHLKWGPRGTLTKKSVDGMARATKSVFPTLSCGVFHSWQEFEPNSSYTVIDFITAAYWKRYGNAQTWLNSTLSMLQRDGHKACFGINILDGGAQIAGCGNNPTSACCPQGPTEGPGTYGSSDHYQCRMIPSDMTTFARLFGQHGTGFLMWRYDDQAMSSGSWASLNSTAFRSIITYLDQFPTKSWLRGV
jgi:PKD repeat protein